MRPQLPTLDPADGAITNAVVSRNQPLQPRVFADRINLGLCQFVCTASFATVSRAVQYLVGMVVLTGIPTKIADVIVPRVAVIVAALHAFWAWRNECSQDKGVGLEYLALVCDPQSKKRAAIYFVRALGLDFPSGCGPHSAMIRDFVKTFVPDDCFPVFHTRNHTTLCGTY